MFTSRRRAAIGDFTKLALPALIIYCIVVLIPIVITIAQSLTNATFPGAPAGFIGLDNFAQALASPEFGHAFLNTVLLTVVVTVVPNALGFALAMLLDKPTRMFAVLRSFLFIPVVLSSVVVSFIWQVLLTQKGAVNQALGVFGIDAVGWLQDPQVAIWSIGIVVAWSLTGLCVVTYLAGLQSIPPELNEAARIDGAGFFSTVKYVIWPGVAPALTLNTIVLMISGFKLYDHVVVLTGGGPAGATETATMRILQTSFNEFRSGYSAAMAVLLLIAVIAATTLTLRLLQRREIQL